MGKEIIVKKQINLPVKLQDLTRFVLVGREKLVSVRAEMRAIDKLEIATGVKEQKKEEATMLAGALLDAEAKIGEIISKIPDKKATAGGGRCSLPKGITHKQSSQFQTLAENLDKWIKIGIDKDWNYLGFHIIKFENTFFNDGKCFFDNKCVSEEELKELFSAFV